MTRLKANCRFHIKDLLQVAGWMYAAEILLIIIGILIMVLTPAVDSQSAVADGENTYTLYETGGGAVPGELVITEGEDNIGVSVVATEADGAFGGMDGTAWFTFFIAGIAMFSIWMKSSLANCIPRKKEFLSAIIAISVVALVIVAGNLVIAAICEAVDNGVYYSMWDMQFGKDNDCGRLLEGGEKFLYYLGENVYNYIAVISCFFGGYFIGALYYRMNTVLKVVVSVGVPVILFVGIPILTYILASTGVWEQSFLYNLGYKLGAFFAMMESNMWLSTIDTLAEGAVACGLSFLLIRRAHIK